MQLKVEVGTADFDIGVEQARLHAAAPEAGAIVAFTGCVRIRADGPGGQKRQVDALEIEHYPGMTERSVEATANAAARRWPLSAITVIHRVGRLLPGEQIVLVLAASAHRQAAFDGARFIMDYLKTRAVFWKREVYPDGARWIESHVADHAAAAAWDPERD